MTVTAASLDTYLGLNGTIDTDRATLLIGLATSIAQSIVNPLPDGADAVIYSAVTRSYVNPQGVTQETVGPVSVSRPKTGVYFTDDEVATLRRLAGKSGGAFTINVAPDARAPRNPLGGISSEAEVEYLYETDY